MDNHSTQKNFSLLAYLQYLVKNNFFSNDESFFYLIFLVKGHSHNRLDAANSKPRQDYFKAPKIEDLFELNLIYANASPNYRSKIQKPIYDFKNALNDITDANVRK